ncbi:MAG: Ku protein, partial [Mesorhizobium sp.]
PSNVVNLFDALKKSLSSEAGAPAKTGRPAKGAKSKAARRKSA